MNVKVLTRMNKFPILSQCFQKASIADEPKTCLHVERIKKTCSYKYIMISDSENIK